MSAIRAFQIGKSYRHYQVLREVSLEVPSGGCFALFGPNGAGKTTLLRILATLQRPSLGRFEIMGHDGVLAREKVRELLFMIAHGAYLYDELDADENIRFAMALRGLVPTDREIKLALDRVGIGAFSDLKTRFFSAGMRKRLAIAKAILIRPSVLLLDEPYSSLDEQGMRLMNEVIREMTGAGSAVLLTTHNRVKSSEVAERAGILRKGGLDQVSMKDMAAADALF